MSFPQGGQVGDVLQELGRCQEEHCCSKAKWCKIVGKNGFNPRAQGRTLYDSGLGKKTRKKLEEAETCCRKQMLGLRRMAGPVILFGLFQICRRSGDTSYVMAGPRRWRKAGNQVREPRALDPAGVAGPEVLELVALSM